MQTLIKNVKNEKSFLEVEIGKKNLWQMIWHDLVRLNMCIFYNSAIPFLSQRNSYISVAESI